MGVVGIDEVGRGCWAGPLVAAAVLLDKPIAGLKDSKKLSQKQRTELARIIEHEALAVGIGWVWPAAIDSGGITTAVKRAMAEALRLIQTPYDHVIIDGHINYLADVQEFSRPASAGLISAVIKADDSVPAVSTASIIAKVARDAYMARMAETYPEYSFDKHVGYGTAAHLSALRRYGVTEIHRRSFKPIRTLLELAA